MKTNRVLSILIMLAVFMGMSTLANGQELTVSYVGGDVTRTVNGKKIPLFSKSQYSTKLSYSDFVTIEYGGKLELLDENKSKRIILKSPGAGKISVLAESNKNTVSDLTKNYLTYVKKQLTNQNLASKQRYSDFATVTRSKVSAEPEEETDRFSSFKKRMEQRYRDFYERTNRKFYAFRDECNKKYADFVRNAWKPTKTEEPVKMPEMKKITPMQFDADTLQTAGLFSSVGNFIKKVFKRDKKEVEEQKSTAKPVEGIKEVTPEELHIEDEEVLKYEFGDDARMPFNYFGTELSVRLDETKRFNVGELTPDNVADALENLSKQRTLDNLLIDCQAIKNERKLCDWAYVQLITIISEQFCGEGTNESALLIGWLLNQSGYKFRFTMNYSAENSRYEHLYVFFGSKHAIFNRAYLQDDDCKYYVLNRTYEDFGCTACQAKFPNEQPLSLYIASPQEFDAAETDNRTISSKKYPDLQLTIKPNKNMMAFYDSYPRSYLNGDYGTRFLMYAETPLSKEVESQIYPMLRKKLEGLSDYEKVSRILDLMQTGLVYKHDDEVWGVPDRIFFPEETLSYPFGDCEDRAILFTRMVRDLVGLECCLVYYEGLHVAAAVHFNEELTNVLNLKDPDTGKLYTYCEPTFDSSVRIGVKGDTEGYPAILIPLE